MLNGVCIAADTQTEFRSAVADAYVEALAKPDAAMFHAFRQCQPYVCLREALRAAGAALTPGAHALALGVYRGWGARSSHFAFAVCREALPEKVFIERLDVTPHLLDAGFSPIEADLVVSHSLLHYFEHPAMLLHRLEALVKPGGVYVAAHEPNARFAHNAECAEAARTFERERRVAWAHRLAPRHALRWIESHFGKPEELDETVNRIVLGKLGYNPHLSLSEIVDLVDPHFPPHSDGLEWEAIDGALPGFSRRSVATCGHLGRSTPLRLCEPWRARDGQLRLRYPLDGASFTAWWRRRT